MHRMRIVYSLPDLLSMQQAMLGEPQSATYVLQVSILNRLFHRSHKVTFIGCLSPREMVVTDEIMDLRIAIPRWSDKFLFRVAEKIIWQTQQFLKVPYLNVFSNIRLFDVGLTNIVGHDIVYERHGLYKTGLARAAKKLGIPYVLFFEADDILELDFMDEPLDGLLRWRAQQMMKYNLVSADCIICVSKSGKDDLVNRLQIPEEKILVFPNCVDINQFSPIPSRRKKVRDELGLGEKQPLILFVGNFYQWHDIRTLLRAFEIVLRSIPNAHLVMVGDGNTRTEMEELAANLKITESVDFIGLIPHANVPMYMDASDIAVVPYPALDRDIWFSPLKLFEYMASSKAVIASDVGQISRVIEDEKNGLLVSPEDADVLAEKVIKLIQNDDLREILGVTARKDVVEKFSWEQYVNRLEQVFLALVNGHKFSHL